MADPTYAVLYEDDQILVVDKAPGVLTVSHPGSRGRCLLDDLRRDGHRVAPVHRLDRETSGALLLSLDPAYRRDLEQLFRSRSITKDYLALVHGRPRTARASIDVPILDEGKTARVDRRGRRAVTRYEVLATHPGPVSLVRLRLETGRHNQIRVHMAHIGHAVVGDRKFGRRGAADGTARRTLLHAERLRLEHPATGAKLDVRAPSPADFEAYLAGLPRRGRGG